MSIADGSDDNRPRREDRDGPRGRGHDGRGSAAGAARTPGRRDGDRRTWTERDRPRRPDAGGDRGRDRGGDDRGARRYPDTRRGEVGRDTPGRGGARPDDRGRGGDRPYGRERGGHGGDDHRG